jgi:hypothetical protein
MNFVKKIKEIVENFKKRRDFKKKIKVSKQNLQNFLDFSKTIFDKCEDEFKVLLEKVESTIKISAPKDKHQDALSVVRRDIMKTKYDIRSKLVSDLSGIYDALIKTNERNTPTIPVDGNAKPGNETGKKSGPVPGNINIENVHV